MSSRHYDHSKGSSRSTHHDSRTYGRKYADDPDSKRNRSRSRSPRRRDSPPKSSRYMLDRSSQNRDKDLQYEDTKDHRKSHNDWEESDEDVPAAPPPPRITKISIGFSKPNAPIKMNLGNTTKSKPVVQKPTVASVFNEDDDDDEPEEMPAEARMRMRNIGRETPTSAGPNSFGKTKQGFCDAKKVFEKNLKEALETVDKPPTGKLPQTIYKLKGP